MTKKANAGGRKAAGTHDESISALPLMIVDNRPDTGQMARRESALTWSGDTTDRRMRPNQWTN
jgi:hypothetical protein